MQYKLSPARSQLPPSSRMKTHKTVTVHDTVQKKYTYTCTEPVGRNFHPSFTPELTPQEMLALGVFGGRYLNDCTKEFPASWFTNAKLSPTKYDASLNYFGVRASQSLAIWQKNGWICEQHDPRGWFQWYCRYYMGRRLLGEDERQIRRWRAVTRHIAQLKKNCPRGDKTCRPVQRQAILHWAYDSRKI